MTRLRVPLSRSTGGRTGLALALVALLAWMALSDDWGAILNDGAATTVAGLAVGTVISAVLVAIIALTAKAARDRNSP